MIPNKKVNVNKRIQYNQNNYGEVKKNGGDFKMIHRGWSTPFIMVVQVFCISHQQDTSSPARLYNPLLYVPFQYSYPRCLHLSKKFTPLLIFHLFPFNLYDLQHSALHGLDSFVYIWYVCVFQCAFTGAAYFSASSKVICCSIAWWWWLSVTWLNTFSIGFMLGLLRGIKNFVAPTVCMACFPALLFWLGSPSCRGSLPVGLTFFLNVLEKWSRMKLQTYARLCVLHVVCKESLLVCKIWLPWSAALSHQNPHGFFWQYNSFQDLHHLFWSHCFDWLYLVKSIELVLETNCVNVKWNSVEPKFFWVGRFWYFCSTFEPVF